MTERYRARFEDAMHKMDRYRAKNRERAAALNEQLPAISAEVRSPDGAVTVAVNADGMLTGLRLTDRVKQLPASAIADAVLSTYNEAQRDAAQRRAELLEPLVGHEFAQDQLAQRQEFEPSRLPDTEPPAADEVHEDRHDDYDYGDPLRGGCQ